MGLALQTLSDKKFGGSIIFGLHSLISAIAAKLETSNFLANFKRFPHLVRAHPMMQI